MKPLAAFRLLAATLFHRSHVEAEMDEELRSHVESRADDLERSGLPRAEAERRARIEFGGHEDSKRNAAKNVTASVSKRFGPMCATGCGCCARIPDSPLRRL